MADEGPKADFVEEANRLIKATDKKGTVLRVMGAAIFRIPCPKFRNLYEALDRKHADKIEKFSPNSAT